MLFESLAFALRGRIVAHELGGEATDAEGDALGPPQPGAVADHQFDAAAADVDAERGCRVDHHTGSYSREDQPGLLEPADHFDLDVGLGLDAVDEFAAVVGGADGARRLGEHLGRAERVRQLLVSADRFDRAVGEAGRDGVVTTDIVAEAEHLLLAGNRFEGAIGMHVGDQKMERVGTEVERRDAHVGTEDIGVA